MHGGSYYGDFLATVSECPRFYVRQENLAIGETLGVCDAGFNEHARTLAKVILSHKMLRRVRPSPTQQRGQELSNKYTFLGVVLKQFVHDEAR